MNMRRVFASWALLLVSSGCSDRPPTHEVVLVLQSDLSVPIDTDGVQVSVLGGAFTPDRGANTSATLLLGDFPVSARVTDDKSQASFSTTVQLLKGLGGGPVLPTIVVSRTGTDIAFSADRTMMLVLPLLRRCACQGTSCPLPGDPECDNIDHPRLQPLDPAIAPPSSFDTLGTIGLPAPPVGAH